MNGASRPALRPEPADGISKPVTHVVHCWAGEATIWPRARQGGGALDGIVNTTVACHTRRAVRHSLAALLGRVLRTIRRYEMVAAGERVLVAVSGGSDSIGLLAVLAELRQRLELELVAAHVHHGLRGADADADEECAAAAAESFGVPFVRRALGSSLQAGSNVEERARQLRYRALHELAGENGCAKVATGHTRDDQAETLLLRLIRGSGPRGLSAILPVRSDAVVRPLLGSGRSEIETVVKSLRLDYRLDASNRDPRFLRTHVRHRVLPLLRELNPSIVESLAHSAALQQTLEGILRSWTSDQLERVLHGDTLDVAGLRTLPAARASYVVRAWLEKADARCRGLARVHVDAVVDLAFSARKSGRLTLSGGLCVRRRGESLVLGEVPKPAADAPRVLKPGDELRLPGGWRLSASVVGRLPQRGSLPGDLWSAVCAWKKAGDELEVRSARRGERVQPLGMQGRKKLSDLFIDHKVPSEERSSYPVIDHGGSIVWVPGVVRTDVLRVDERTRQVLWLRAERHPSPAGS